MITGAGSYVSPILSSIPHLANYASEYRRSVRSANPNSGIGLETSLQFAAEGARLFISDVNEPAAFKAAEYIAKHYPSSECQAIKCDVSSEEDVKNLVEAAVAKWGRLDVMVCALAVLLYDGDGIKKGKADAE